MEEEEDGEPGDNLGPLPTTGAPSPPASPTSLPFSMTRKLLKNFKKRIHASRMRTARFCGHLSCTRVPLPPYTHVPLPCMPPCHACPSPCLARSPGPCISPVMHAPCRACPLPCMPSPTCGETDASENITLPQTSFAGGKNHFRI